MPKRRSWSMSRRTMPVTAASGGSTTTVTGVEQRPRASHTSQATMSVPEKPGAASQATVPVVPLVEGSSVTVSAPWAPGSSLLGSAIETGVSCIA